MFEDDPNAPRQEGFWEDAGEYDEDAAEEEVEETLHEPVERWERPEIKRIPKEEIDISEEEHAQIDA